MSNAKKPAKGNEDTLAALQSLIAKGKKEGMIRAADLHAQLEKMDLSPEKIEEIYDRFEAMNIQIIAAELELDIDDPVDLVDGSDDVLDLAAIDDQAQTSFIYDANGSLITEYRGTENRIMVSIDTMPLTLQHAFVAVEDARFYTHNGVDVKRIIGAFVTNFISGSQQQCPLRILPAYRFDGTVKTRQSRILFIFAELPVKIGMGQDVDLFNHISLSVRRGVHR